MNPRSILFLILCWFGSPVWAQESIDDIFNQAVKSAAPKSPYKIRLSPFASEKRFESATNPVLKDQSPQHFGVGFKVLRHLASLEYSRFFEKSGNETYNVERHFQDFLAWYHYAFFERRYFRIIGGVALGFYQESVETQFYDVHETSSSGTQWAAGSALGFEVEPVSWLVLSLQARLLAGENLDPNPNSAILAQAIFQF